MKKYIWSDDVHTATNVNICIIAVLAGISLVLRILSAMK